MEDLITKDVLVLIGHINYLCSSMGVEVFPDIKIEMAPESILIRASYMMKDSDRTVTICKREISVPHDDYLDNKEMVIKSINYHLYNDILIYTQFDKQTQTIDDKYKWN